MCVRTHSFNFYDQQGIFCCNCQRNIEFCFVAFDGSLTVEGTLGCGPRSVQRLKRIPKVERERCRALLSEKLQPGYSLFDSWPVTVLDE